MCKIIISRLKEARKELGYTQNDVAEILNIDRTIYNKIENGIQPITVAQLVTLCQKYKKSASYFLGLGEGKLTNDELEILETYRALPDRAKESGALMLKGWLNQVKGKL